MSDTEKKKIRLSKNDKKFARLVYIDKIEPEEAYKMCGFHIASKDSLMMGKYPIKKGEEKSIRMIKEGTKKKLERVQQYASKLTEEKQKEYETSDTYSRDTAVKACLENIQIAKQAVKINSDLRNSLDVEDSEYAKTAKLLTDIITQNQKMVLEFTKEISKLQNLYIKNSNDLKDNISVVFQSDLER